MEIYKAKIEGVAPLLMHNGRLADPLYEWTKKLKEITSKAKKTEDDLLRMREIEWRGGLYTDEDGYPCLPAAMIDASIKAGAKNFKQGKNVASAVICMSDARLQDYGSKKKADDLYEEKYIDCQGAVVQRARVFRTRPIFRQWSAELTIAINVEFMSAAHVERALQHAGAMCGMGDYRPRYGRFRVNAFMKS